MFASRCIFGFSLVLLLATTSHADTVSFQEGDGGSYSETASTPVSFSNQVNLGSNAALTVYSFEFADEVVSLVSFPSIVGNDTGQIPPGSVINSAQLELTRTNNSTTATTVHEVLTAWDEYTVTGGTWTDVAGTDYGPSVGSIPMGAMGAVGSIDITAIVQDWVSGADNNGVLLRPTISSFGMAQFGSDDATTPSARPRLVVEFTPVVATDITTWGKVKAVYR